MQCEPSEDDGSLISVSLPHFTWAHSSFQLILINECTLLTALASCVIHLAGFIWTTKSLHLPVDHILQTVIKQQSVCEAELLFLKFPAFPYNWLQTITI